MVAGKDLDTTAYAVEELEEAARLFLLLQGHPAHFLTAEQVASLPRI